MDDLISRQDAIDAIRWIPADLGRRELDDAIKALKQLPSAEPEIIRCKDCKHNPKDTWFGCPMSHLSEKQRPDDAWCWKGERRTDG